VDLKYTLETFNSSSSEWSRLQYESQIATIFSSPEWSRTWWQHFGSGNTLHVVSIKKQGDTIGIAPLMIRKNTCCFIGSIDVCDYLDCVVAPNNSETFFEILLQNLRQEGVLNLQLAPLRPDSAVFTEMTIIARRLGWQVTCTKIDVTIELDLPNTWEKYQEILTGKQRHELRRKLRRLDEEGEVTYYTTCEANNQDITTFLRLFRDSRTDKAEFMTPARESFFKDITKVMADQQILEIGLLEIDSKSAAITMSFNCKNNIYLYNSGYDPQFAGSSVGLLSKALCIKHSIEEGRKKFDFLKGGENYKLHLGGQELPIYSCSFIYN
jgi:CelD/BcsL family acetyltransferase involved in cellulose biosynthesis